MLLGLSLVQFLISILCSIYLSCDCHFSKEYFCLSQLGVLYVTCTLIGFSLFRFRGIFFYDSVENTFWNFDLGFIFLLYPYYYYYIWSFHCVLDFLEFCVRIFLYLPFSLTEIFISSIMYSVPQICSSVS